MNDLPAWFESALRRARDPNDGTLLPLTGALADMSLAIAHQNREEGLSEERVVWVAYASALRLGMALGVRLAGVEAGLPIDLVDTENPSVGPLFR